MADLLLLGQNVLELTTSVVTVTSEAAGKPKTRLYDRDRGPQWEGSSAAQQDIDVDAGVGVSVSFDNLGLVNHNLAGVQLTFYADTFFPPTTQRAQFTVTGTDSLQSLAGTYTQRYSRIRIPAFAAAPKIGDFLLGTRRTITRKPVYGRVDRAAVGNVVRDESPGGYAWKLKRGAKRIRLKYGWDHGITAERDVLEALFDDVDQSAKFLLVQDIEGATRWTEFVKAEFGSANASNGRHAFELELLEAL